MLWLSVDPVNCLQEIFFFQKLGIIAQVGHDLQFLVTFVKRHIICLCIEDIQAKAIKIDQRLLFFQRQRLAVVFSFTQIVNAWSPANISLRKIFVQYVGTVFHNSIQLNDRTKLRHLPEFLQQQPIYYKQAFVERELQRVACKKLIKIYGKILFPDFHFLRRCNLLPGIC